MTYLRPCEKCRIKTATEKHHKFSKTKGKNGTAKLYKDYIDHSENIQYLCYDCHHNKPLDKWTEKEFCNNFGIEQRSKSGKWKERK